MHPISLFSWYNVQFVIIFRSIDHKISFRNKNSSKFSQKNLQNLYKLIIIEKFLSLRFDLKIKRISVNSFEFLWNSWDTSWLMKLLLVWWWLIASIANDPKYHLLRLALRGEMLRLWKDYENILRMTRSKKKYS